jgi:type IV secretory pathway TrbL component
MEVAIFGKVMDFWAGQMPSLANVIYLVGATAVALTVGAWTFKRVDDQIAVEL